MSITGLLEVRGEGARKFLNRKDDYYNLAKSKWEGIPGSNIFRTITLNCDLALMFKRYKL